MGIQKREEIKLVLTPEQLKTIEEKKVEKRVEMKEKRQERIQPRQEDPKN